MARNLRAALQMSLALESLLLGCSASWLHGFMAALMPNTEPPAEEELSTAGVDVLPPHFTANGEPLEKVPRFPRTFSRQD